MARIHGFHHVALHTLNFDSAVDLYTRVLGFSIKRSWGSPGSRCTMLDAGNDNIVELSEREPLSKELGPFAHLALRTDDLDTIMNQVREEGIEITVEPKNVDLPADPVYPVRVAFFKGAAGELIEIFQEL